MSEKNDLNVLNEYIKECHDAYTRHKESVLKEIENEYGIGKNSVEYIKVMSDEKIENINYDNIDEIFSLVGLKEDTVKQKRSKSLYLDLPYLEFVKKAFKETKDKLKDLEKDIDTINDVADNLDDIKKDYIEYVHSDEFLKKKRAKMNSLEIKIESLSDDDPKKKELLSKVEIMKKLDSLDFLCERLNALGEKEEASIMRSFFETNASNTIMNKFKATCKKLKVDPRVIQYFFNFEDRHLSAEYAPFNNFFLFVCVRFIAYADVNKEEERFYANKILGTLTRFVNHSLYEDEEKNFINLIIEIDSHFLKYTEKFKEKNTTYREHPVKISHMEKIEEDTRQKLLRKLKLAGVEVLDSLDSISLRNILKDHEEKEKLREELEEKCKTYGIKVNKGEALENLKIIVNEYEREQKEKEDQMVTSGFMEVVGETPFCDSNSTIESISDVVDKDSNDERSSNEILAELDDKTTSNDSEVIELNVEDLGLDYDIVEDDSEKKSDVQVSTNETVKVNAPVFTLSIEDTNLDHDIVEKDDSDEETNMSVSVNTTTKSDTPAFTMYTNTKKDEEDPDIDELEKLVAGPLK